MNKGQSTGSFKDFVSKEWPQFLVFGGLSILVPGSVLMQDRRLFQRFFGPVDPFLGFFLVTVAGSLILIYLLYRGWFAIFSKDLKGLLYPASIASVFGAIIILVDLTIVFPENLNIPFPESLVFYPVMAFLVEILFHAFPLAILLTLFKYFSGIFDFDKYVWVCILIVALLEPAYQILPMASSGRYPAWAVGYVGLHIFLINLFQLYFYKRYDFISMYAFRLVYYLFWHIGWGFYRLQVLF